MLVGLRLADDLLGSRKLDEPGEETIQGETPRHLTKIFLSSLHDHFIKILEERLSPEVVRFAKMDFVVTVPAIWSPGAKQATESAAAMAGFCGNKRIMLVSEPVGLIGSLPVSADEA